MKKILACILTAAMAAAPVTTAFMADNEPSVYLNGTKMTFEKNPFIENNRTLIPMRAIFEAVGASVTWDQETKTAIAIKEKNNEIRTVTLQADLDTGFINETSVKLEVPARVIDGTTFVPLRFVTEALGEKVEWDNDNYSVVITTD